MMSRTAGSTRAVLALAAAVSIGATMVADAGAATPGTWSVLYKPSTPSASFDSISGSDPHNAWAVGTARYLDGTFRPPMLAHWDGTRWTAAAAPEVAKRATFEGLSQVKAVSKDNTWAIGTAFLKASRQAAGVIAHRTDGHWTTRVLPGDSVVDHISVISPGNVWILGALGSTGTSYYPQHPTYWHWNGRTWTSGKLGAIVTSGSDDAYYATAVAAQTTAPKLVQHNGVLLRYSGGRWVVDRSLRITPPRDAGGEPLSYQFGGVVRRSATNVDVSVQYFESDDLQKGVDLYHWNGTSWKRTIRVETGSSEATSTAGQLCGDGAGGVWMLTVDPPKLGLVDIRNGKIVARTTYPNVGQSFVTDLTLRPNTRRAWLAGGVLTEHPKQDVAKIVGYVP